MHVQRRSDGTEQMTYNRRMESEVESKYEALLSSIGDGIMATDTEGKIYSDSSSANTTSRLE